MNKIKNTEHYLFCQHGNSDPDPDRHQNDASPQHWNIIWDLLRCCSLHEKSITVKKFVNKIKNNEHYLFSQELDQNVFFMCKTENISISITPIFEKFIGSPPHARLVQVHTL